MVVIGVPSLRKSPALTMPSITESMARMENPLAQLSSLRLSEEVVRPVAHLLLTEDLVGTLKVSRITPFRVGPPVAGKRRLELAWQAPRQ